MWQNVPERAPTAELFAGNDAICIAAIGATLIDGSKWGWVGDWGKICGLNWYYSGVKVCDIATLFMSGDVFTDIENSNLSGTSKAASTHQSLHGTATDKTLIITATRHFAHGSTRTTPMASLQAASPLIGQASRPASSPVTAAWENAALPS